MRDAALGAALNACLAALVCVSSLNSWSILSVLQAGRGGQVVVFPCTIPTIGPGALAATLDEAKLLAEDEKKLFIPRNKYWRNIGEECAEEGIGVSMFLGMSKFIDIGSIGKLSSLSVLWESR
jgi:protein transport protein SEC24